MKIRNDYIDYIKAFGLLMVILAHVECPLWLRQLRDFDVPLMVFMSGYLASQSSHVDDIKMYLINRILRLAVPSWLFLCFFYIVQSLFYKVPTYYDIFLGFTFQLDAPLVGFLWIVWVFLSISIILPIIKKIKQSYNIFFGFIVLLLVNETLLSLTALGHNRAIYLTLFTAVPWGFISYLGFNYDKFSSKFKSMIVSTALLVFFIMATYFYFNDGHYIITYKFKYPARLYYLSYSIPLIIIFFELFKRMVYKSNALICFISSSSFWIYLWHILSLYTVKLFITDDSFWLVQYITIVLIALLVTYIQNRLARILIDKYKINIARFFIG